jgi:hypothetical protein
LLKPIPLLVRRGGRDSKKMARSLLKRSGRGGHRSETWLVSDHPVCGAKVGFAKIFLTPQPPLLTRRGMRLARTSDQFVHTFLIGAAGGRTPRKPDRAPAIKKKSSLTQT